jgi:hypothetical protein
MCRPSSRSSVKTIYMLIWHRCRLYLLAFSLCICQHARKHVGDGALFHIGSDCRHASALNIWRDNTTSDYLYLARSGLVLVFFPQRSWNMHRHGISWWQQWPKVKKRCGSHGLIMGLGSAYSGRHFFGWLLGNFDIGHGLGAWHCTMVEVRTGRSSGGDED